MTVLEKEMRRYKEKDGVQWLCHFYKFYGIRWLDDHFGADAVANAVGNIDTCRQKVWRVYKTFEEDRKLRH